MTAEQFREIALSLPDAEESSHMGHPDFRRLGKVFATLADPAKGLAMVKVPPDQQPHFLEVDPQAFFAASGAWGRAGCTMVRLQSANLEMIGEAMTAAWQCAVKRPPKKS